MIFSLTRSGEAPALLSGINEYGDEFWYNDYYVIVMSDELMFAIGERRPPQKIYN
jgi:hypothetical protein